MDRTANDDDATRQAGSGALLFLFRTTHAALGAEETLIDAGFWCDVVPRPPAVTTELCGLAIEVRATDRAAVERLFANTGLAFETYQAGE
ncbi:MAG: DUF3343 domain-containing protein [Actinomycetota bacterium]|jgi:hypothetical protein|nr:DUF3343 domain-containing protein [Actinomycetota bacterium]MCL6093995.1 DUF3343 domain-containing protein [Actinomycetota bacterium]MDA8167048.1 DUF3343 domain-containing protein [Actinomycetota bacterium]